jgi:hypothetical protein
MTACAEAQLTQLIESQPQAQHATVWAGDLTLAFGMRKAWNIMRPRPCQ